MTLDATRCTSAARRARRLSYIEATDMDGSFGYIAKLGETRSTKTPARTFRRDLPTFVCTYCERVCRASQEAIDEARAQLVDSITRPATDAAIARSFDVCLACALDEQHVDECVVTRVRCSGEEDERGRACCEGDDVRTCSVKVVTDKRPALFTTNWCATCRRTAELNGYRVVVGGACNV